MKIIDCFIFYNEINLLNYRLNILDEIVDFFIIVESNYTFVGKKKELYFEKNKDMFKQFQHKIIHIVLDDFPFIYPNINISNNEQWINEKYQRNQIARGFEKINLSENDILIISDLDEIPNRDILCKIKNKDINVDINTLEMDLYYCNLNHKKSTKWYNAKIISYEIYKKISLTCDDIRFYKCPIIENGGWHLSYFGDCNFIKNKIENFCHQELNNENFTNLCKIKSRLETFSDIFERNDSNNQVIKI